jgi:hypothetical protein
VAVPALARISASGVLRVTITSARPAAISSNTVRLSGWSVTAARGRRSRRSARSSLLERELDVDAGQDSTGIAAERCVIAGRAHATG